MKDLTHFHPDLKHVVETHPDPKARDLLTRHLFDMVALNEIQIENIRHARAEEREACARLADAFAYQHDRDGEDVWGTADALAAAIRARGDQ